MQQQLPTQLISDSQLSIDELAEISKKLGEMVSQFKFDNTVSAVKFKKSA